MYKEWFDNNLGMVGKWGGASFLFGIAATSFVFGFAGNTSLRAYVGETIPENFPNTQLNLDFNSTGKLNEVTAPLTNTINGFLKSFRLNRNINLGTGIPSSPIKSPSQAIDFSKFFSSSKVSSNDVMSFLKEAAVTGINLTILVISITSQILKGLLGALK
jgi:hypothetical protein